MSRYCSDLFLASLGTLMLAILPDAGAADWPQFRGPDSTGVAKDSAVPAAPKVEWSVPLPGRGLSSPVIVGENLYLTCSSGPTQERLHMICVKTKDGSKVWERQLRATGRTMSHPKTSIAACTPCSDGKRIFALWSSNDLAAFDLDGNLLWVRGLTVDYPNASNSLGMASSPIVIGNTVVVMIENDSESYSLGVDADTGRNVWKLDRPKLANWTSPLPLPGAKGSKTTALLQSSKGVLCVDPASGSALWEYSGGASTMSSGVVADGVVYAPSFGITAIAPQTAGGEPEQLWRARQINPSTISPIVLGKQLFSINGAGVLTAADAKTGNIAWKLRLTGPFSSSPVGAGSLLVFVNEQGLLQIVDTKTKGEAAKTESQPKEAPEGGENEAAAGSVVSTLQLPLNEESKELVLGTPALNGGKIFIRADSALWCLGS